MLTKNPLAEAPVKSKNFFSLPVILCFKVESINAKPNKKKTAIGNKNKRELLNKFLNAGMKNSAKTIAKTPINKQKVVDVEHLFISFPL